MSYWLLRELHMLSAVLTLTGFMLRGYWMITGSSKLQLRITRIAPHIVDTVFFLSGVAMLLLLSLNPFLQSWLLAKFAGLILYVLLGSLALHRGPTLAIRVTAFVAALVVFSYIVGVAVAKSAVSWLAFLA